MLLHQSADDVFGLADGADKLALRDTVVSVYGTRQLERACIPWRETEAARE